MDMAEVGGRRVLPIARCVAVAAVMGFLVTGCNRERAAGGGTVVIATAADADNLFPPLTASTLGNAVNSQIFESLADVGDSLNVIGDRGFVPSLADSWTWAPDSLSIAFHLDPRARWHDGKPVRASDVRFSYALTTNPQLAAPGAADLANIDSVSVRDSLTPVIWFKRRSQEQFYDAASELTIIPEHVYGGTAPSALASSEVIRHPVGSGRFRFVRWDPGSRIEVASNASHYRKPAGLARVIWTIAPGDPTTAQTEFLSGAADVFENVRPDVIPQLKQHPNLRVVEVPAFAYGLLQFNLRDPKNSALPNPIFGDPAVRRAITMAVDRAAIVHNIYDTLATPALGPMVRAMPTTDSSVAQIPYDPAGAARILDSLGWKMHGGVRERAGRTLAFRVITPSSSKEREQLAVLLQAQLKKAGIEMDIQPLDFNAFLQQQQARTFDAAMERWRIPPTPGTVRSMWSSRAAHEKGSNDVGGYASARFDREIDSALDATTLAAARPLFTRAYDTIVEDAPAIWLVEPHTLLGLQRRIHIAPLRADAWYAHLADWYIPAGEQIERDKVGAADSARRK